MAMALRERTCIRVIGPDAISRDGLIAQLRARHEVRILESGEDPESRLIALATFNSSKVARVVRDLAGFAFHPETASPGAGTARRDLGRLRFAQVEKGRRGGWPGSSRSRTS